MYTTQRTAIVGSIVVALAQIVAVGTTLTFLSIRPAEAATCPPADAPVLDARLAAKADEGGMPAVRQFVTRTRAVHGLDMNEAVARIDRHRDNVRACEQEAAAAGASPTMAETVTPRS